MFSKELILKIKNIIKNKGWILFLLIFALHLFLRFYQLDNRNPFGWDQVDNAWAAKNIIVDHNFPLLGMEAKGKSGFFIGPLYYYFISFFYWIFNLDPIVSGTFAGVTSIFTFFTFFYIGKKLFNFKLALIFVFIYTVSFSMINFDRNQWPVNFIPLLSFIIFYAINNILNGNLKYILLLFLALGFSFHIHFTSIFYLLIILLLTPFYPRNKDFLKKIISYSPFLLIWFVPNFLAEINDKSVYVRSLSNYIQTYYHGFHLVRFLQLIKDAFITFEGFLSFPFEILKPLKYFLVPLFFLFYYLLAPSRKKFIFCYLIFLWFFVPWFIFSLYKGEISQYYFSLTTPISIMLISYFVLSFFEIKNIIPKVITLLFFTYYSFVNIQYFFNNQLFISLNASKESVKRVINEKGVIKFKEGDMQSYLYYIYSREK